MIVIDAMINCINLFVFHSIQEWEQKAVEAKEAYTKLVQAYEANGGDKNVKVGKKRKSAKKTPAKKKKADSDDDDDDEAESD